MKRRMKILRIMVRHVPTHDNRYSGALYRFAKLKAAPPDGRNAGKKIAVKQGFQPFFISDRISRANAMLLSSSVISVSNLTEWLTSTSSRMSCTKMSGIPP